MPRVRGNGEGSIFQDSAGRWQVEISLPDGRRRRRVAKSRADANKVLQRLRAEVDQGLKVDGSLTVGAWLEAWFDRVLPGRVKSPRTVANYRDIARIHIVPALGKRKLQRLTVEDVERMLVQVAGNGRSVSTVTRAKTVLGAALEEAERRQLVERNVARLAVLPQGGPGRTQRSLTGAEAGDLLAVAHRDRLAPMWMLGILRGLRPGELAGLTWADVDLAGRVVHLRESLKVEPAGPRRRAYRLGELKAGPRRSVRLPDELVQAFEQWKVAQAAERLTAGRLWADRFPEHGGLCFTTWDGKPVTPEAMRKAIARLAADAGIEGTVTPYTLRHTAISLLSAEGVPPERIADLVGHANTRMIFAHYRHAVTTSVEAGPELDSMLLRRLVAEPVADLASRRSRRSGQK